MLVYISSINYDYLYGFNSLIIVFFRLIIINGIDWVEYYGYLIFFCSK